MIRNYLKIAFRSLIRNKAFTLINMLGLVLGISLSTMLYIYVSHELSYDSFHQKADRHLGYLPLMHLPLTQAKLFVLDLEGHGVIGDCVTQVMIDFMNTPKSELGNASCLPISR